MLKRWLSLAILSGSCLLAAPGVGGNAPQPDPAQVTDALLKAARKKESLKPFMGSRVLLKYHQDGRCLGSIDGETTVGAAALDGTVNLRCRHQPVGGACGRWEGKPLKPRSIVVKFNLREATRKALDCIDEQNRNSVPSMHTKPTLDRERLTLHISCGMPSVAFHFRHEGRALLVYKVVYSEEDPG